MTENTSCSWTTTCVAEIEQPVVHSLIECYHRNQEHDYTVSIKIHVVAEAVQALVGWN